MLGSFEVLEVDFEKRDLFDHEVEAEEIVTSALVVTGGLVDHGDEALVVNVQGGRMELLEAEFFKDVAEVHDVFGSFESGSEFSFSGTGGNDGLLLTTSIELSCVFSDSEASTAVGFGVFVGQVGGVGPGV